MPIAYVIIERERASGKTHTLHGTPGVNPSFPGMTQRDATSLFQDIYAQHPPYRTKQSTIFIVPVEAKYVKPRIPPAQGTLPKDFREYRRLMGWE